MREPTDPIPAVPTWQLNRLVVLLDALGEVPLSAAERRSLVWLCGFEADTVENLAAVIRRSRAATVCWLADELEPDLDAPGLSNGELNYREGQTHLCHALRERARELDGGGS
jgi:hypothetical protein